MGKEIPVIFYSAFSPLRRLTDCFILAILLITDLFLNERNKRKQINVLIYIHDIS